MKLRTALAYAALATILLMIAVTSAVRPAQALAPASGLCAPSSAIGMSCGTLTRPADSWAAGHQSQVPAPNPPTGETQSCNSPSAGTGVSPASLGLFDQATCTITLSGAAGAPVSDGSVSIQITSTGGPITAVLGCTTAPCLLFANGTGLNLPCGTTAPNGAIPSTTCTSVSYTIESTLAACINTPFSSTGCNPHLSQLATSGSMQVSFIATPGNAGASAVLSVDPYAFSTSTTNATLLVSASPFSIPSNGTIASVISATFACDTTPASSPFPISPVNPGLPQPVLGTHDIAICGAGLPGGFTFTASKHIILDNGLSEESVGCGLASNINQFGGSSVFTPYKSSTAPLAFTCTGAAVEAIGAGSAGDAAINVVYNSAVAGLTAVGSTLITVTPSPQVQVGVTCSPSTIAAGSPGSICTASLTDPSGVPIAGLTGATVTFTTSDTSRTIVEACQSGASGAIYPNHTPPVIPLISALTPCQTPTSTTPSQVNTLVNGQAQALIVSPAGSAPGSITISATIGLIVPPSYACESAPVLPQPILPNTFTTGQPLVTGCGFGNPVGSSGIASGFPTETLLGSPVAFQNSTSGSTTIEIGSSSNILFAVPTPGASLQLTKGCNQIVVTTPAGTPISALVSMITPSNPVISIWRFSNATKQFAAGYFADTTAPTDFVATGNVNPITGATLLNKPLAGNITRQVTETYFVCVTGNATIAPS